MSEGLDLVVPAADSTTEAAVTTEAQTVAATPVAATELATPEPKVGEGETAAAVGQGANTGEAPDGGTSKVEGADGAAKTGEAAEGAPEAYADFTMPDGFQLDADMSTELTTIAKELNLSQDKAQKLIDLGVKQAQGFQAALKTSVETAKAQWADAVRSDAEIGGAKLTAAMATAKKAVVAFGTPQLVGLLNETGLGQHPEFLRLLTRVGDAISEDTLVNPEGGGGGKPAIKDHARRLYPGMT